MSIQNIQLPMRDKRGRFVEIEALRFEDRKSNPVFVVFGLFMCFVFTAYAIKLLIG